MNREGGADNGDGPFVFRSQQQVMPSSGLEEELSAAILRIAKERFRRRDLRGSPEGGPLESDVAEPCNQSREDSPPPRIKISSSADESGVEGGTANESDTALSDSRGGPRSRRTRTFLPVVSADDDLSHDLIRPAARNIIGNLDRTLTVLHNARVAGVRYLSESPAASDEEDLASGDAASRPRKRRRPGRGRSPRRQRKPIPVRERRVGRPRHVHVPRGEETEREMRVRVAREKKVRIPVFSDEEEEEEEEKPSYRRSRGPSSRRRRRKPSPSSRGSSRGPGQGRDREKKLALWSPRDWRDVVGAAALAGFSPAVLARATQRCSNLFREQMEIRTLTEDPDGSTGGGAHTTRYAPGNSLVSSPEEETAVVDDMDQIRSLRRQSSVKPGPASSDEEEFRHQRRAARKSPAMSTAGMSFCPLRGCSRATEGFTREANLARHLLLVHGEGRPVPTDDEGSSADDMDGAVHVDGFLKPIKIRRGWRGPDTARRTRSRSTRLRERRSGLSDDGYGAESSDNYMKTEPGERWL